MWYARITLNRDYPPRPRPGVLHLTIGAREGSTDVTSADAFAAYIAQHPEIGTVLVYDSRFPQRPMEWRKFIDKHSRKIWPEAELLRAVREVQRQRVADPAYVPTLAEAMRHPEAFVEGMTEGK